MRLSVYIIASNEEDCIAKCLDSCIGISSEIILVYNDCTDRTVEIAKSKGVNCYENTWTNFRDQKNFALSKCKYDWTLNIDADEVLSDKLISSLRQFLDSNSGGINGLSFNRKSFFLKRWINHGDWYPDTIIRVSRKGMAKWEGLQVHEFLKVSGRIKLIDGDILHYSYKNINQLVEKSIKYTDLHVNSHDCNLIASPIPIIIIRAIWRFLRSYIIKLGFLDGMPGFIIAVNSAFSTYLKYIKFNIEREN